MVRAPTTDALNGSPTARTTSIALDGRHLSIDPLSNSIHTIYLIGSHLINILDMDTLVADHLAGLLYCYCVVRPAAM